MELDLNSIVLVGWSLGAPVALEAAKLLGNKVKVIVLVDRIHSLSYAFDSTWASNFINSSAMNFKNMDFWLSYFKNDSILAERYVESMPFDIEMPKYWEPILVNFCEWMNKDLKKNVSVLSVPIRAINSDQMETNFDEWNKYYNDFDAISLDKSSHFLVWEYPQKFNEKLYNIITELND
jgi:pimeloyl-ACP methyl ester carboxylesterase